MNEDLAVGGIRVLEAIIRLEREVQAAKGEGINRADVVARRFHHEGVVLSDDNLSPVEVWVAMIGGEGLAAVTGAGNEAVALHGHDGGLPIVFPLSNDLKAFELAWRAGALPSFVSERCALDTGLIRPLGLTTVDR